MYPPRAGTSVLQRPRLTVGCCVRSPGLLPTRVRRRCSLLVVSRVRRGGVPLLTCFFAQYPDALVSGVRTPHASAPKPRPTYLYQFHQNGFSQPKRTRRCGQVQHYAFVVAAIEINKWSSSCSAAGVNVTVKNFDGLAPKDKVALPRRHLRCRGTTCSF